MTAHARHARHALPTTHARHVAPAGRHRTARSGGRGGRWGRGAAVTATAAGTLGAVVALPTAAGASPATSHPSSTASSASSAASSAPTEQGAPSGQSAAAREARAEPLVPGTPCSISARACVDLDSQRAWLIDDGEVVRGPMTVTTGARGYETPVGHSFRVYRQDIDHVSEESRTKDGRPAPMPYSTFFADGGVAFHGGSLARASAGCVHLDDADAQAVYEHLGKGDKVQVVHAGQEKAARRSAA